jgi:hypothetical protein
VCVKWAGSPAQQPAFTNRRIRPLYFAQKLRGNRSQDLRQRRHAGFFRELLGVRCGSSERLTVSVTAKV